MLLRRLLCPIRFSSPLRGVERLDGRSCMDGSFSAQVSRSLESLDANALEARLCGSMALAHDVLEWLDLVTPWWLAGLREQDQWRAFVQLFTGLVLVPKRLARRYYSRVVVSERVITSDDATRQHTAVLSVLFDAAGRNVRSRRDLHQRGEFAVVALALFPLEADADFAIFENIRDLRNDVAHGDKTISLTTFPVSELRSLFGRYLDAAIQEHLSPP